DGGTTYDMPLYRIPLDGITIGTPVALFNVLKPMSDVWDSLTHTDVTTLISGNYGTVKGYRSGPMVTLRIDWKTSASGSWN
ncbi:hypothetical protein LIG27_11240, partial [Bifidobacterium longum]|nr:hypothetical protein [Bifidobacterium longum]